MDDLCFIITRHINNNNTNKYWLQCYLSIRKFYKNKIIIIDDNSNEKFIQNIPLENTTIIKSEFPKRAELLPYYYFYKNKYAKKAIILHDSSFIQKKLDIPNQDVIFLWHFPKHIYSNFKRDILPLSKHIKHTNQMNQWFLKNDCKGCFGVQSIITLDFLTHLEKKYSFFSLLPIIKTRDIRMKLERLFGLLCFMENDDIKNNPSLCGLILNHPKKFKLRFKEFHNNQNKYKNLTIVKVWTGR